MPRHILFAITLLFFAALLASCGATKRTVYFKEDMQADSNVIKQAIVQHTDAVIQPDDILAISVASLSFASEEHPSQIFLDGGLSFSSSVVGNSSNGATQGRNSYLVDSSGYIDFPSIGRIRMAGLSIREAKEQMSRMLVKYIKEPVVEVRIVNYRITMLGEVSTPGQILAPNHKISIVDAIAASGGIPLSGRKDNVLIIRENGGQREFARIDLNSRNVFNSPYYYLHQNDIVYVEATRIRRQEANEFFRLYLPAFTTLLSSGIAIYALVSIANK